MSRRSKLLAFIFAMAFLTSLVIAPTIRVKADANTPIAFSSGLTLYSPVNTTYSSNVVEFNCTFNYPRGALLYLNYSIDGKYQDIVPLTAIPNSNTNAMGTADGLFQLPQLLNGSHELSVGIEEDLINGTIVNQTSWVNTVYFAISSSQQTQTLTPNLTPTVPELSLLAILPLIIATFSLAVILRNRKTT